MWKFTAIEDCTEISIWKKKRRPIIKVMYKAVFSLHVVCIISLTLLYVKWKQRFFSVFFRCVQLTVQAWMWTYKHEDMQALCKYWLRSAAFYVTSLQKYRWNLGTNRPERERETLHRCPAPWIGSSTMLRLSITAGSYPLSPTYDTDVHRLSGYRNKQWSCAVPIGTS